jgi:hypothetical protein
MAQSTNSASSSEPDLIHRIKTGEVEADQLADIHLDTRHDPEKGSIKDNKDVNPTETASAQNPTYSGWKW